MTKELLTELSTLITEVNSSNKKTHKQAAIAAVDSGDLKMLLSYTYDIYKPFRVTPAAIKKSEVAPSSNYAEESIFSLLDDLADSVITGHAAIAAVKGFVEAHSEFEDVIYKVIDKDLKLGCNVSTINKAFPGLVPTFDVSLGYPYADHQDKVTQDGSWMISHKLDGIRSICVVENNKPKFFTRKGHEILTLDNLKPHIEALGVNNVVFDGELCIVDENGNENFRSIAKEWNRKNHTIENPSYQMFDMLTREEFDAKESQRKLSERLAQLNETIPTDSTNLLVLEQVPLTEDSFAAMQAEFRAKGWEGLIIRKDCEYKGKRSADILKMKDFHDGEFEVIGVENGTFPVLNKESGVVEYHDGLKSVYIDYNGSRVDVGSGLTLKERKRYFENPDDLIGKVITVQYFEETENDSGTNSMRFPTLKHIHGAERMA